jgi:hypothetical protein
MTANSSGPSPTGSMPSAASGGFMPASRITALASAAILRTIDHVEARDGIGQRGKLRQ